MWDEEYLKSEFDRLMNEDGVDEDEFYDNDYEDTANTPLETEMRTLSQAANFLTEKRASWHQQLLVAGSALFGILISLHNTSTQSLHIRLMFAVIVVLLALGILSSAASIYSQIDAIKRFREAYVEEAISARREHREKNAVSVRERKLFSVCAIASYVCFGISVVLLAVYAVMLAF